MTVRKVLGFVSGAFLLASCFAHAFLGWPPFARDLAESGVDADHIRALSIGWYFGSVSMFTFGVIVIAAAVELVKGRESNRGAVTIIGLAYAAFGAVTFLRYDFNTHFLGFFVIGLLVLAFALWRTR